MTNEKPGKRSGFPWRKLNPLRDKGQERIDYWVERLKDMPEDPTMAI